MTNKCPFCGKEMRLLVGYYPEEYEYRASFLCCGFSTPCGRGNTEEAAIKNAEELAYNLVPFSWLMKRFTTVV